MCVRVMIDVVQLRIHIHRTTNDINQVVTQDVKLGDKFPRNIYTHTHTHTHRHVFSQRYAYGGHALTINGSKIANTHINNTNTS